MIKYCRTCGYLGKTQDNQDACRKHKIIVKPQEDFCSWHIMAGQLIICERCGQSFSSKDISCWIGNNNSIHIVCNNCLTQYGTCATCLYENTCGLNSDHSEPRTVYQTIQQGFMTSRIQVLNPNLVQKHCVSCRCSCLNENNEPQCQKNSDRGINCPHWILK